MVFGLGTKNTVTKQDKSTGKSAKSDQAKEAEALLKQMQEKKDGDECPFC